ncbi:hypothetical protein C8J57DRAFT_1247341 [Mycena rebaudengoi]|nr:hypothetical protein C8J57DRAFT_1247341 [Mycena rebaudengoi]
MSFNADIALGALLVSTWACSVLYTVEVIQLLVSSAIAMDSVAMIANYASVYLYTITHWGDLVYVQNQYWASHFGPIGRNIIERMLLNSLKRSTLVATGVVTALVQSFLAEPEANSSPSLYSSSSRSQPAARSLVASRSRSSPNIRIGGKSPSPPCPWSSLLSFWLITEAVTDISIASALLWEFRKAESPFKETRSLLNRLVAQTIQTGTSGASVALAVLVTFLANPESNGGFLSLPFSIRGSHIPVPTGIAYLLGRVYCITMLANLNSRKAGKMWSGMIMSSGANLETRGESGKQERGEGDDEYGSIHVHRTALPGQGLPDDNPAVEIEMTVNDSASYSAKKKQDLFAA